MICVRQKQAGKRQTGLLGLLLWCRDGRWRARRAARARRSTETCAARRRIALGAEGIGVGLLAVLAEAGAELQASALRGGLDVLRGIPVKLEQSVVFCFFVDLDRFLIDFAADADDIASDNGWRVGRRNGLRIRGVARSGIRCVAAPGRSARGRAGLAIRGILRSRAALLLTGQQATSTAGRRTGRRAKSRGLRKERIDRRRLEAADELAVWTDVEEAPRAVFLVHRIFVGLAHEVDVADAGTFGEVVEGGRVAALLLVKELDAADIVFAAPDHLVFFLALGFGDHRETYGKSGNDQHGGEIGRASCRERV